MTFVLAFKTKKSQKENKRISAEETITIYRKRKLCPWRCEASRPCSRLEPLNLQSGAGEIANTGDAVGQLRLQLIFHAPKCDPQSFWEILGLKYQWGNHELLGNLMMKKSCGMTEFPLPVPLQHRCVGKKWNRMSNDLKNVKNSLRHKKNVDYLKKGSDNKNRTWERDNEPGGGTVRLVRGN